jgi:hypothetical protein
MGQLHCFLNEAVLTEIHLNDHLYTWSNERAHPTLECIDRVFVTNEWECIFLKNDVRALSTHCSDHAPLLLQTNLEPLGKQRFMFRSFWSHCARLHEIVQQAWHYLLQNTNPFACLGWLFKNTAKFLKSWSDWFVGNVHLQLAIAKEVLSRLKAAGDHGPLAQHEDEPRKEMQFKTLGLSSLQRTISRQESRVIWLKEGDTPT